MHGQHCYSSGILMCGLPALHIGEDPIRNWGLTKAEVETIIAALWIATEATAIVWPERSAACKVLADHLDSQLA